MFDHCSLAGCHAAILADTEHWKHPVCVGHYGMLGMPVREPNWGELHHRLTSRPKMFDYINTTQGPVKAV